MCVIPQRHMCFVGTKVFLCPGDTTLYDPHDHHFIPALNRCCTLNLFNNREMMTENLFLFPFSDVDTEI